MIIIEQEAVTNRDLLSLRGNVAVVTGAASGIGLAIAERLIASDAETIMVDVNGDSLSKAVNKLGLPKCNAIQADVASPTEVEQGIKQVVKRFGSVDILVHSAGIYPYKPMLDLSFEEWQKVISINLNGTFLTNQAVARQMVEQGHGGKIVNIGSASSLRPWMVGLAAYDASKAGIIGMSRNLALELAPHGITVNVVAPGSIDTPGTRFNGLEISDLSSSDIPLGRKGTADDVAKLVLTLVAKTGDYVTGSVIPVDGGFLLTSSNTFSF